MIASLTLPLARTFLHSPHKRKRVLEMLDECRVCGCFTPSLSSEQIWAGPESTEGAEILHG